MLEIKNIKKDYVMTTETVHALRGVNLRFRESEFVSILGPSGCGKTTLLNIIGGLDRYTDGDLMIGGISTSEFDDEMWDAYRNATVGFVFQNYNLISHISVLENVELALKLSGYKKAKYKQMAIDALARVDMADHCNKKPAQLSGGQMQRVSIARALVNNPKIVLADEPTGALDSELSEQIMGVLQEVSKDKLVIMVTHNAELAEKYSTRIIKVKDGLIVDDSNPYEPEILEEIKEESQAEKEQTQSKKNKALARLTKLRKQTGPFKTSYMDWSTAMGLSFKNLIAKKRRTALTSIAGSVGIIGLGLVLAFSNGINLFLENMQNTLLAAVPIGIYEYSMDYSAMMEVFMNMSADSLKEGMFPDDNEIDFVEATNGSSAMSSLMDSMLNSVQINDINEDFVAYMDQMNPEFADAVHNYYGVQMNLIVKKADGTYLDVSPDETVTNVMNIATNVLGENGLEKTNWNQLVGDTAFMSKYYELMAGQWPTDKGDIVLVVNEKNEVEKRALTNFGFDVENADLNGDGKITFDEVISDNSGYEIKLVLNNDYYEKTDIGINGYSDIKLFRKKSASESMYNAENNITLRISGVLRVKEDSPISVVGANLCYTTALAKFICTNAHNSDVTQEQIKLLNAMNYSDSNASVRSIITNSIITDSYVDGNILKLITSSLKKTAFLKSLGVDNTPVYINIYAKNLASKDAITSYIEEWNQSGGSVFYFDVTEMFMYNVKTVTNLCVYALLIVASISLIVSSIMIGIITGNSVVERTREIGILRAMGARKKDILDVFMAETSLIGLFSGVIGIGLTYALAPLVGLIAKAFCGISNLAIVNGWHSLALIGLSLLLAVISGLIPSVRASKKNVVDALRIE